MHATSRRTIRLSALLLGVVGLLAQAASAPALIQASITTGTLDASASQTGRLTRDAVMSGCTPPKPTPAVFTASGLRAYESHTFTNGPTPACVRATVARTGGTLQMLMAVAYLTAFDPSNIQTNYLGDSGVSFSASATFAFAVPASATFVIVIHEVEPAMAVGATYRIKLDGLRPQADFGGDYRSDVAVYRPSTGQWFRRGVSPETVQYGIGGDWAVPADYNGDGAADVAVYRPSTGQWFIRNASPIAEVTQYGAPCASNCIANGDIPIPADYNGDGRADVAIYRKSTGQWFIRDAAPIPEVTQYGLPCTGGCTVSNDIPVPADYDNDGDADIAIYRYLGGLWFVRGGPEGLSYGSPEDLPVPGDYDNDGDAEIAVYRPSTGQWFRRGVGPEVVQYGMTGDVPLTADFTGSGGDGADTAVYRPPTGQWVTKPVPAPAIPVPEVVQYGMAADVPLGLPFAIRVWRGYAN